MSPGDDPSEQSGASSPAAPASEVPGWARDYQRAPNATFVRLFVPMLFSLLAEPLTGLVDTAFVARLGAEPLAALGVGVSLLSGLFWIFNFLHIGTQTEVAQSLGSGCSGAGGPALRQATRLACAIGLALAVLGWAAAPLLSTWMGASDGLHEAATAYLRIRLLAAPAVLMMMAAFGALRGAADMRTPLFVAVGMNALNIALDAWWIPSFGIAGAAWATAVSQGIGSGVALAVAVRELGWAPGSDPRAFARFLASGGDIFARTLALNLFLVFGTAVATRVGAVEASAHQAVRTVWTFGAFLLDAYAATAQTLIAHFLGAQRVAEARRTAARACVWGGLTGALLSFAMFALEVPAVALLAAPGTAAAFGVAWWIALLFQPLNALAFVTDGVHWGTGDFRYMRNGMWIACVCAALALWSIDPASPHALARIWWATAAWITLRAVWGMFRLWPGSKRAPLGRAGLLAGLALALAVGCGPGGSSAPSTASEDAAAPRRTDGPDAAQAALNGCLEEDWVDATGHQAVEIRFGGDAGKKYVPRCVVVSPGAHLRFLGSFDRYPFVGGTVVRGVPVSSRGTNRFAPVALGDGAEFRIDEPGEYGYYCDRYAADGMLGAVRVVAE